MTFDPIEIHYRYQLETETGRVLTILTNSADVGMFVADRAAALFVQGVRSIIVRPIPVPPIPVQFPHPDPN